MIKQGTVYKIYHSLTLNKYRRMFNFVGICTNSNNKTKTFTIKNFYGKEFVTMTFLKISPNIVKIDVLTSYNFKFNKSKLKNIKKFNLFGKTDLISEKPVDQLPNPFKYFHKTKNMLSKERKRLRNKFRI